MRGLAHTPRRSAHLTGLLALLVTALALLALATPPDARAATGPWTVQPWTGCTGGTNSGDTDDAGRLYIPCGNPATIGVYDASGELVDTVTTGQYVSDVAPSPDGSAIYLAGSGAPKRMLRTPAGGWALDPTFVPQSYVLNGATYSPKGLYVTVDGAGNLYLSDGAWSGNETHTVVKYAPDGHVITRFAQYVQYSWAPGDVYWMLTGLDVTRDGSRVYTTEVGDNRVQVWARQGDGSYAVAGGWGGTAANNADRGGYCNWTGWQGAFAAPYDVQLDGDGDVYVINTTCKQVLEFTAGGQYLRQADVHLDGGDYPRPHGFAVATDGRVYVGENSKVIRPVGEPVAAHAEPPATYGGSVTWAAPPVDANFGRQVPAAPTTPATTPATPGATGSTSVGGGRSGTTVADRVAPKVDVRWVALPRAARSSSAIVRLRCSEACTTAVRISLAGTKAAGTATVHCGAAHWCVQRVVVRWPARSTARAIRSARRAQVVAVARDAAGNSGRAARSAALPA